VGQDSQNDNNQNVGYPALDGRIASSYAARSAATSSKPLYDSYVRAIRWASDRIGDNGIIGFVTNGSFIETGTFDGLRRCLVDEFSSLYVFHLRGNQRTAGERSRKEGGKVFGSGSRAPVAISLLVKNRRGQERGALHLHDVGDYLTTEAKLAAVASFVSVAGISQAAGWGRITPDEHGDWWKPRDAHFGTFAALGSKDKNASAVSIFGDQFSLGVGTNRDAWVYGSSRVAVAQKVADMAHVYNSELQRFNDAHPGLEKSERLAAMEGFVTTDPARISWSSSLEDHFARGTSIEFDQQWFIPSLYRAYSKQWLYFGPHVIHRPGRMRRYLAPAGSARNLMIGVPGVGARTEFLLHPVRLGSRNGPHREISMVPALRLRDCRWRL
jgi:predicted helicase